MNIKELNEKVRNNQKKELEKKIEEIERYILWRGDNGFNDFEVSTNRSSIISIREWMIESLKEYFENNGYKVEVKEIGGLISRIEKLFGIYEPEYLMIISWEEIN